MNLDKFHNISNDEPEIIKEMEKLLHELKNQNIMKPESDIPSEDEEKIRQELKKMGYIWFLKLFKFLIINFKYFYIVF